MIPGRNRWPGYQIQRIMWLNNDLAYPPVRLCNHIYPHHIGTTADCLQLWQRWSCTPLFLSLFLSLYLSVSLWVCSPHPPTPLCNITPSLTQSTLCPFKPLQTPHAAVLCFCCIHLVHMLCIIALGGLETCGSHFISFVIFGFLFFSVNVICITLFCVSVIVLRMAMVPECLAFWTL